jgi:Ca-activated chloride channel family protein
MGDAGKIDQAKDALKYIFRNLNDEDRFNLITFASEVRSYNEGWQEVSGSTVADVLEFIDTISAGGGTSIDDALKMVLDLPMSSTRPTYIIFLTDGLPTVGERDIEKILANALGKNEGRARIFSYGVGYDLNFVFIDRLSKENGGFSTSVAPDEDLEVSLSQFYGRIKTPVLTDCEVSFSGFRTDMVYPEHLPDIFLGSQVAVTAKYFGRLVGDIILTGKVGDDRKSFRLPVDERSGDNPFVPRIWAKRRVGYLLNQIRMYGDSREIIDEVVKLAKQYGIITPYTSYLVVEDIPLPPGAPMPIIRQEALSGGAGTYYYGGAPSAHMARGKEAMDASKKIGELEEEAGLVDEDVYGIGEYVKEVGDKTFILKDDVWTDTEYDEEETYTWVEVEFLSDDYFDLIADNEELAQYFSVGDEVIVIYDGTAYHVKPSQ